LQTDPISNGGGIFLGDKKADESILLGDSTVELLKDLLEELRNLTNSLSTQVGVPVGSPLAPTNASAAAANNTISNLLGQLDNLKSKTVKIT